MSVKQVFDASARVYDRSRRQLIPCFDDYYGTVLDLLPADKDQTLRVLDLGAGTGLLSMFVAEAYPRAHVTLIDVAPEMLKLARERFAEQTDRFEFIEADYARSPLVGEYDAVVSALSIHHLSDAEKAELFRNVHQVLVSGGVFVNADEVLGATPENERRYRDTWLQRARERGASEEDLAQALERQKADRMSPLAAQLGWLEEAGFQHVDCWYKNFSFVVYAGVRP